MKHNDPQFNESSLSGLLPIIVLFATYMCNHGLYAVGLVGFQAL